MSEVLRTYTPLSGSPKRRSVRRGRKRLRRVVLGIMVMLLIWAAWATRDSEAVTRFIPAGQAYQLYAGEIIKKRMEIAESSVWNLLPPESPLLEVRKQLSGSLGMPDWVLNNLVYDLLHVSGKDLDAFNDVLVVTHMSRTGCLIEKCRGFVPGIDNDHAGGLELRRVRDANVYYAVRGRVLLMSPSRQAIIRALTLTKEDSIPENALSSGLQEMAGGEDLCGNIQLPEGNPLGKICESLRFAARMTASQIRLSCQGTLRPAWRDRLSGLLEGATPQTLKMPPDGLVSLSADFGKPLNKAAAGVAQALDSAPAWLSEWISGENAATGAPATLQAATQALLAMLGPGIRLSWQGIDQNEIFPAPELVLFSDCNDALVSELLASLPAAPAATPEEWSFAPQYDPKTGVVHVPLIGGPSLEPAIAVHGKQLLVSSSSTVADSLLAQPAATEPMPTPGNLYLRIRPLPAFQACTDSALQFAEFGLIRGQTPESFKAWVAPYLELAQRIDEVAALAAHDNGEVRLDLKLLMKQAS